jgi:hypothetical protein
VQTVASNTGEPERQNRPVRFGKPGITRRQSDTSWARSGLNAHHGRELNLCHR